jgi:hypothetical protein
MAKKKRLQMQRLPKSSAPSDHSEVRKPRRDERYEALVAKYRPGTPKEVDIDPSGSEEEFEARLMRSWMNGRDIPVEELSILFNRDEATIRRWLEMTG